MKIELDEIPIRSILHFLGCRGSSVNLEWMNELLEWSEQIRKQLQPRVILRRFSIIENGKLEGTIFTPKGKDVSALLTDCQEAVLMAATLGIESERILLRASAPRLAFLQDAILSAAIETVCDQAEDQFRTQMKGLYVTDRFSPGYGDMPLEQSREICQVLSADRMIGLSVTASGIMIPRKSVTAILGMSNKPVRHRKKECHNCKADCSLREE